MSILENKFKAIKVEIQNLSARYPDFVLKSQTKDLHQEIPVFAFHSIDPVVFRDQLEYLQTNGYRTLSTEEFLLCLRGEMACSPRSVVLTIDDGRQSVWRYGYPLLKKYQMKAVLFVLPGHTGDDDCPVLRKEKSAAVQKQDALEPLLSWKQLAAMHASGCFDIQSHTVYHHLVYVSSEIKGVYVSSTPGPFYTLPVPKEFQGSIGLDSWDTLWGMPIYESQPLMAGRPRYLDGPAFRNACRKQYQRYLRGERDVVVQKKMAVFMSQYLHQNGTSGRLASPQETAHEMMASLQMSKDLIQEHIPDHRIVAVCWPFGIFCHRAIELAKQAGYAACFCATLPDRKSNRIGDEPFFTVRLKNDFLFRLPGKGRRSLSWIFRHKAIRRLRGETGY